MAENKGPMNAAQREKVLAELHRDIAKRQTGYRARALKLLPHICTSCAREFEGKRLRELTVHHRDHNHKNNPPDGSNWELLCLFCHDHEHEKLIDAKYMGGGTAKSKPEPSKFGTPFENLPDL